MNDLDYVLSDLHGIRGVVEAGEHMSIDVVCVPLDEVRFRPVVNFDLIDDPNINKVTVRVYSELSERKIKRKLISYLLEYLPKNLEERRGEKPYRKLAIGETIGNLIETARQALGCAAAGFYIGSVMGYLVGAYTVIAWENPALWESMVIGGGIGAALGSLGYLGYLVDRITSKDGNIWEGVAYTYHDNPNYERCNNLLNALADTEAVAAYWERTPECFQVVQDPDLVDISNAFNGDGCVKSRRIGNEVVHAAIRKNRNRVKGKMQYIFDQKLG